jgi:hypothetical protein
VSSSGCAVAGSWDGSCCVFDVHFALGPPQLHHRLTLQHDDGLYGVSVAVFDVPVVATACADSNVYLWRGFDAPERSLLQGHKGEVRCSAVSLSARRFHLHLGESHHVGLWPQRAEDCVCQR